MKKSSYTSVVFTNDTHILKKNLVSFTATNIGDVPLNILQRELAPQEKHLITSYCYVFDLELKIEFCKQTKGKKAILIEMITAQECP